MRSFDSSVGLVFGLFAMSEDDMGESENGINVCALCMIAVSVLSAKDTYVSYSSLVTSLPEQSSFVNVRGPF